MAKDDETSGVRFEPADEGVRPPLQPKEGEEPEERFGPEVPPTGPPVGPIPLHPAFIRLPASMVGRVGAEFTGYSGFLFTEQELNDLGELWSATGLTASPIMQAAVSTVMLISLKLIGCAAWVKAGRPTLKTEATLGIPRAAERREVAE